MRATRCGDEPFGMTRLAAVVRARRSAGGPLGAERLAAGTVGGSR